MSGQTSSASLLPAVRDFAQAVAAKFKALKTIDGQAEAQIVAPVESLLTASQVLVKGKLNITNESATAEQQGRPDFAVGTDGLLQGYVELKAPGKGARPSKFTDKHDKAQWAKFRKLPNLLYTDGNEWALYQEGSENPVAFVVFEQDITTAGSKAVTATHATSLAALLSRFFAWEPIVPKNPKDLALGLAKLCHYLREDVERAVGDHASNLSEVMREWRARLFPDADDKRFADAYAQTVAYALLLAHSRGLNTPDLGKAVTLLEPAHGLLGQALNVLTQPAALAEVRPAVDVLFRYVLAVDLSVLAKSPGEPWLYFYEDFLAEYDPNLRKDYGVYYTPAPVVKAQVALVTALLRDRFGLKLGFADENVTVLDPGVGTATYLLGVIESGVEQARAFGGPGYIGERATVMGGNIHGFETLVGPYAVSHLRVSEELARHGAKLPSDGIHIYLTDTLESPNAAAPTVVGLFGKKLSDEHARALKVKGSIPILVCIGNPPYDRHPAADAEQRGGWVRHGDKDRDDLPLLHSFIGPVTEEKRGGDLKNLYNSYVYFWRWALWKVFEKTEGRGIVAFITASSYLRGPAFLGMREHMRRTFDEMWIIDLGGDNLGPRKTPNVFAIQTPVAIAIGARYGKPNPETPAEVHYCSLAEGTRDAKLARLLEINDWKSLKWEPVMAGWRQPLLPQRDGNYWLWPELINLFPWQYSGVQMKRTWPIAPDQDSLKRRWQTLVAAPPNQKPALFRETEFRTILTKTVPLPGTKRPNALIGTKSGSETVPKIVRFGFRSLDRQWVLADSRVGDRMRPPLWHSHGPKQVYMTSLLSTVLGTGPAAIVTAHVPDLHHYRGSFGGKDVIPLWRNAEATEPNVTKGLLEELAKTLKIEVGPEDLFAYCYAVLSAPTYADRFSEDLSVPGPRVPITKDPILFTKTAQLGRRLIGWHTYGERLGKAAPQGKALIQKAIAPSPMPDKFAYDPATATLHVGTGEIRPVSKALWEFSVSGYEVLQRWLAFRMAGGAGKTSSGLDDIRPTSWPSAWSKELLELLWALEATVALRPELDDVLNNVISSPHLDATDLPTPTDEERAAPQIGQTAPEQGALFGKPSDADDA